MTRAEHIAWAKERALAELDGDHVRYRAPEVRLSNALASMRNDLGKHPETRNHDAIELGDLLMFGGHLSTEREVRQWIEGIQ